MPSTVKTKRGKGQMASKKDDRRASVSSCSSSDSSSGNESDYLDSGEPRKKRRTREKKEEKEKEDSDNPVDSDSSDSSEDSVPEKVLIPVSVSKRCYGSRVATASGSTSRIKVGAGASAGAEVAANDIKTFEALGVRPWLAQSLSNLRIFRPTAIQKGCIPAILRGDDCIGCSRTGTGKTVAFAAPMLQKLAEDPCGIFGLVLTATRELAQQIYEQFTAVSGPHPLRAVLITGGADMCAQAIALAKRPHLVVATPGRLADHIAVSGQDTVGGLARLRVLVLDEADRLLVGGDAQSGSMLPDLRKCLEALPPPEKRQTLVFTATMTDDVRELMDTSRGPGRAPLFVCDVGGGPGSGSGSGSGSGLAIPSEVSASSAAIAATSTSTATAAIPPALRQMFINVEVTHREHYLHVLLNTNHNAELAAIIVFCNRNDTATYLHHLLRLLGHRVTALYGQLPQRERTDNLGRFRAGAARILVATDVAARGLDIPEVALVVNYDLPRNPDDYIHRVGRTARAGRAGDAISLVGQRDVVLVHAIEARVGRPLVAWAEEGVNLETRVVRDALTLVGQKRNEALLNIEENREVSGKRKRGKQKLNM